MHHQTNTTAAATANATAIVSSSLSFLQKCVMELVVVPDLLFLLLRTLHCVRFLRQSQHYQLDNNNEILSEKLKGKNILQIVFARVHSRRQTLKSDSSCCRFFFFFFKWVTCCTTGALFTTVMILNYPDTGGTRRRRRRTSFPCCHSSRAQCAKFLLLYKRKTSKKVIILESNRLNRDMCDTCFWLVH